MTAEIRIQQLSPRSEFRFELEQGERLSVRLTPASGDAQVFGADLIAGTTADRWYTFGDEAKACISSLNGCTLELLGQASTEYLADDEGLSPFQRAYSNLHFYLEAQRIYARDALKADLSQPGSKSRIRTLGESSRVIERDGTAPPLVEHDGSAAASEDDGIFQRLGQGPRVMVIGPESAGKSTLVQFLANCALKSPAICNPARADTDKSGSEGKTAAKGSDATGWWPTIVSLDPAVGNASLPGTISLLPLTPIPHAALPSPSPVFAYGTTTLTTGSLPPSASAAHPTNANSLFIGSENLRQNEKHVKRVIDWLAATLEKRLARDPRSRCSGILVDTPGVTSADAKTRYGLIQHIVKVMHVDTIIVLGHEKLNIEMSKLFGGPESGVSVVKLPKSGGVVEIDSAFQQRLRSLQVRSYFYGGSRQKQAKPSSTVQEDENDESAMTNDEQGKRDTLAVLAPSHAEPLGAVPILNPYSTTIPFDLLEVYRIAPENMAPSSALPIGATRAVTMTQLIKLDPANSAIDQTTLLNSVLAVMQAPRGGGGPGVADSKVEPPPSDDEILGAPILGFIYVCVVSACPGIPRKMLLLIMLLLFISPAPKSMSHAKR